MLAVLAAMALVVLDAGIVNVALPVLADSLKSTSGQTILVVTAYQLALVMGLLPCAHLAGSWGHRRLFVWGVALFSCASLLCALASSLPLLVAARFVQGLGGAAIMALGIALLRDALGTERLGAAIGWNAMTVALCSAAGPTLGAIIVSVASWRCLFLVGLPVSALALLGARSLPEVAPRRAPVNAFSISLYGVAVALLVIAVQVAVTRPFSAIFLVGAAVPCFWLLVRRERTQDGPILPLDLLAAPQFRTSVVASICCFTGQSAGLVALAFYLQTVLGHGPLVAGLIITCWPLAVATTSGLGNRASGRFSAAWHCTAGGAILATGLLLSATLAAQNTVAPMVIGALLCGTGFGLFQLANNRSMFLSAPPERSAAAGGMQGTARLTGQTSGTLMMSLIFACTSAAEAPRIGLAVGGAFALAAALVSMRGLKGEGDVASDWQRLAPTSITMKGCPK